MQRTNAHNGPRVQSFTFFISSCGFAEADKTVLPESRLKGYEESGRNSKILVKPLALRQILIPVESELCWPAECPP